jgi:hypothetical protein
MAQNLARALITDKTGFNNDFDESTVAGAARVESIIENLVQLKVTREKEKNSQTELLMVCCFDYKVHNLIPVNKQIISGVPCYRRRISRRRLTMLSKLQGV